MLVYLFLTIKLALSGKQSLTPSIWLNWTLPSSDGITFFLGIHSSVYQDNKWAGVGFKNPDSSQDMIGADILSFYMASEDSCLDRYANTNDFPPIDQLQNLTCASRVKEGDYYIYSWINELNTGDSKDFNFKSQDRIMIIWAIGDMTNGDIAKHGNTDKDRGHYIVYLISSDSGSNISLFIIGLSLLLSIS